MSEILDKSDNITCSLLSEDDLDQAARLVGEVFSEGAPGARALNISAAEITRFVSIFCPKFYQDGLSVVAKEPIGGRIIGAMLTDDLGVEASFDSDQFEIMAPSKALIDELGSAYYRNRSIVPREYAHFFFIAVSSDYQGRGIAARLLDLSLKQASRKGYTKAVVEATGVISQHIFREAGFVKRAEVSYASFVFDGRRPFESIKEHPSAMLLDKDIV